MALAYVGGNSAGAAGTSYSVSLTALTGGIASAAAIGDLVVVNYGIGDTGDVAMSITTTGYITVSELYANGTRDVNQLVAYKVLTAADASVVLPGSADTQRGSTAVVHVWRGEDTTTVLDVAATTATGTNTGYADPPAITPVTAGAIILSLTASGVDSTPVAYTVPGDRTNVVQQINHAGTNRGAITTVGSTAWTSGAFDPAALSGGEDSAQNTFGSVTLAIRPAGLAATSFPPGLARSPHTSFRVLLTR